MKKYASILVALGMLSLLCLSAAGCSGKASAANASDRGEGVDVDLTKLSSTMVYAEVFNIMSSPDDYMGKTVRMSGPYYASYYDKTDQYYHYVVVEDATSCCAQGLEFIWNGDHAYPDDFPDEATKIEVTGVFDSYDELGKTYYFLSVDDLSTL